MRIKVLNNRQNYMELPMTDAELNFEMRRMGIHETVPKCKVVEASENNNPMGMLEGQVLNMDEVNFFARRMESLTEYEQKVLSVYAENHGVNIAGTGKTNGSGRRSITNPIHVKQHIVKKSIRQSCLVLFFCPK